MLQFQVNDEWNNEIDLANLTTFTTNEDSFRNAKRLLMNDLSSLNSFTTGSYSFYYTTKLMLNDIPNLTQFTIGSYSFYNLPESTLNSILFDYSNYRLSNVNFTLFGWEGFL